MNSVEDCRTYQYADLNILHRGNPDVTLSLVKRAIRMGYDTVAINIDIGLMSPDGDGFVEEDGLTLPKDEPPTKKKKKKGNAQPRAREQMIPEPYLVDESQLDFDNLEKQGKRFRQYSRITFTLNDASVIHNVFSNSKLKKFDIVAIRPGDIAILTTMTRKTDAVDIVTISQTEKNEWLSKPKLMEMMRIEGVGFEFCYAPALSDRTARREALTNGRTLVRCLRGRGVLFSSQAESVVELRAPVDAMNMLSLWGIESKHARNMISGTPRQVLLRAEARRTVRGALHVAPISVWTNEDGGKSIEVDVPAKKKSSELSLQRLLSIKEFRAQVEVVPRKEKERGDIMEN